MVISIEKSTSIKGVAVLMMLFIHLFHGKQVEYLDRSYDIWTYNGISFSEYLSYAADCVQIYVILSGYGLYKVYERGKLTWKNQLKRIGKLYVAYWITLLLFLPIVFIVNPSLFKLEWSYIWGSLTAIGPFYYLPAWFLFPYVLLSLLSPFLIKYMSSKPIVGGNFLYNILHKWILYELQRESPYRYYAITKTNNLAWLFPSFFLYRHNAW